MSDDLDLVKRLVGKTWYVTDSAGQRWADDAPEDAARALIAKDAELARLRKAVGAFVAYADAVTSFCGPDECNEVADGLYDTAVAFARAALNTQHKEDTP
jgi:P2-related tail formation protein